MALERELQRRDRLLRTMVNLRDAGQGLGVDLIEKLREERGMLPIYRRKLQEVQAQIAERDHDIRSLKRDEKFTRIIELQVEFASWTHEAGRLDKLMKDVDGEAAQKDAEVHGVRARALQARLEEEGNKSRGLADRLREVEESYSSALQKRSDTKQELKEEQEATRDAAVKFKQRLQERKKVEEVEDEIKRLQMTESKLDEELNKIAAEEAWEASKHRAVSEDVLRGPPPPLPTSPVALWALRRALASGSGTRPAPDGALFVRCLELDPSRSGLISPEQLAAALTDAAGACCAAKDAAAACARLLPEDPMGGIRWLDWLVAFDRIGHLIEPPPPLPAPGPLRAACLQARCTSEDLRRRVLEADGRAGAEATFRDLGLSSADVHSWVEAWWAYGATGLLARLPLSEVDLVRSRKASESGAAEA